MNENTARTHTKATTHECPHTHTFTHRFKVTASAWQFNGRGGKWSRSGCRAARVVKAGCSGGIVGRGDRRRVSSRQAAKLMPLISLNTRGDGSHIETAEITLM